MEKDYFYRNLKERFNGMERTYDFIMKNEVQKLKKFIEQGEVYKPYKYT